jgi:hypothetical protein
MADALETKTSCQHHKSVPHLGCRRLIAIADNQDATEKQLMTALAINDTLGGTLTRYDELFVRAIAMRQRALGRS